MAETQNLLASNTVSGTASSGDWRYPYPGYKKQQYRTRGRDIRYYADHRGPSDAKEECVSIYHLWRHGRAGTGGRGRRAGMRICVWQRICKAIRRRFIYRQHYLCLYSFYNEGDGGTRDCIWNCSGALWRKAFAAESGNNCRTELRRDFSNAGRSVWILFEQWCDFPYRSDLCGNGCRNGEWLKKSRARLRRAEWRRRLAGKRETEPQSKPQSK